MILTASIYDEWIVSADVDIEEQVEYMIENPIQTDNKDAVYAFNFFTTISNPTLAENGEIKKTQNNLKTIEAFILDYDSGITIDEVKDKFRKYKHYGYTSYSHMKDGETQKFRVVIPLKEPMLKIVYLQQRKLWEHKFKGCDKSSFQLGHLFFPPCFSQERIDFYDAWINDGELMDLSMFKIQRTASVPTVKNFVSDFLKKQNETNILQSVRDEVSEINMRLRGSGEVHRTLLRLNAKMQLSGVDKETAYEILSSASVDEKSRREIQTIVFKFGRI